MYYLTVNFDTIWHVGCTMWYHFAFSFFVPWNCLGLVIFLSNTSKIENIKIQNSIDCYSENIGECNVPQTLRNKGFGTRENVVPFGILSFCTLQYWLRIIFLDFSVTYRRFVGASRVWQAHLWILYPAVLITHPARVWQAHFGFCTLQYWLRTLPGFGRRIMDFVPCIMDYVLWT